LIKTKLAVFAVQL